MRYEETKQLNDPQFKRLCGVPRPLFQQMREALQQAEQEKVKSGRPSPLSVENQLLLTLQYWREYRTLFHISTDWGISESAACRCVRRVEDRLHASGRFALPKRGTRWQGDEQDTEVVVVDAFESPIERPKKNSAATTAARKNATP